MSDNIPQINGLTEGLADIRRRIEELEIATLAYAAVGLNDESFYLSIVNGDDTIVVHRKYKTEDPEQEIVTTLGKLAADNNVKIVSATIASHKDEHELGSRLWLEEDIVPHLYVVDEITEETVRKAMLDTCARFDEHGLAIVPIEDNQEVKVAQLTTKEYYRNTTPDGLWEDLEKAIKAHAENNVPLVFISATPQGGGVALMRHALIRFLREMNVEAHWYILQANSDAFEITKGKFHNVLQKVAPPDVELTQHDKDTYMSWINENAQILDDVLRNSPFICIDDPQPSGLIPYIREVNPDAKIAYRSHIHLDKNLLAEEGSPQHGVWQFLYSFIKQADVFIAHPVPVFVPSEVEDITVEMPATTDLLDGLNKPLSGTQMAYYRKLFNKILLEHAQEPLDDERPYIIQIARFDPSKGIPDVIEAYRALCEELSDDTPTPQLVLVGHGSVDDPDGVPMYNMTLQMINEDKYHHLASDIKVVRLHHNDQILNSLMRGSHVALQLSHKEGFEVKVTEGLEKGKPVIAYKTGGIPLQIADGKSGYLVETKNSQLVAEKLHKLFSDDKHYEEMSKYAVENINAHHFTVANAFKWLQVKNFLLDDKSIDELRKEIKYTEST